MHYRKIQFLIKLEPCPYTYSYHNYVHIKLYSNGPSSPCPQKQYMHLDLLRLASAAAGAAGLIAGRDPKDCAVGHIAENSPVPCAGPWGNDGGVEIKFLTGCGESCRVVWTLTVVLLGPRIYRRDESVQKGGEGGGGRKANRADKYSKKNAMWELMAQMAQSQ